MLSMRKRGRYKSRPESWACTKACQTFSKLPKGYDQASTRTDVQLILESNAALSPHL